MARIGILDLQGGVVEHLDHLERLGVTAVRVKQAKDFQDLTGLILPGGESSCLGKLLQLYGLDHIIRERFAAGLKLWGTCAGAILIAKRVDGEPSHLALMDVDIQRNAFGSQLDSFNIEAEVPAVDTHPLPLTFIRAPKITRLGQGVHSLLGIDDYWAAAEDQQTLVTIFHPELTANSAFHRYFCHKCNLKTETPREESDEVAWQRNSWMRFAATP